MKIDLLLIDPQIDFAHASGALYVKGADSDMERMASFSKRMESKLTNIRVSLDSHNKVHIANPIYWINPHGERPNPFTIITSKDMVNGTWSTKKVEDYKHALNYLRALEINHRYEHRIWPEHCLIGTAGHCIVRSVWDAINSWTEEFAIVDWIHKGSNPTTEHFSAVRAEVPDDKDPSTQLNLSLVQNVRDADEIVVGGIAGSHCVAHTIRDLANSLLDDFQIKKFVLLTDTVSPVIGCEKIQTDFIAEMIARGMRTSNSEEYSK